MQALSVFKLGEGLMTHAPIGLVYMVTCIYELHGNNLSHFIAHPTGSIFESRFRFLTYWNYILQTIFFTICVLADLIAKDDHTHILRRIQNRIMVSLAYPLALFVGVTFWAIYLIDRELILPAAMDQFFPTWLNHCMHTNIMMFVLIEFSMTCYKYDSRSFNLSILASVMVIYLAWLLLIYYQTGVWVYPVLHVLSWIGKAGFFLACLLLVIGLYFSGEYLKDFIHGSDCPFETDNRTSVHTANVPQTSHDDYPTTTSGRSERNKDKKKKRH